MNNFFSVLFIYLVVYYFSFVLFVYYGLVSHTVQTVLFKFDLFWICCSFLRVLRECVKELVLILLNRGVRGEVALFVYLQEQCVTFLPPFKCPG